MGKKETAVKARYVPVLLPESLLEQIDDYRFANRLPSRAEGIRALIMSGLSGLEPQPRQGGKSSAKKKPPAHAQG
jgi:metal-responsive CopG/Arc/MetJ family transcriptional regulator